MTSITAATFLADVAFCNKWQFKRSVIQLRLPFTGKIFPRMWLAHVPPWQLYQLSRPVIFFWETFEQNMLNVILQLTRACHGSKEFKLRDRRLSGACTIKQPNTNNPVSISVSLCVSDTGLCFFSVSRSLSFSLSASLRPLLAVDICPALVWITPAVIYRVCQAPASVNTLILPHRCPPPPYQFICFGWIIFISSA